MPDIGTGGVTITAVVFSSRFKRDWKKLDPMMMTRVDNKIRDLKKSPMPPGLGFEKLSGYSNPNIYTIHITGNYKLSMEIEGSVAILRRVARHDVMDRLP